MADSPQSWDEIVKEFGGAKASPQASTPPSSWDQVVKQFDGKQPASQPSAAVVTPVVDTSKTGGVGISAAPAGPRDPRAQFWQGIQRVFTEGPIAKLFQPSVSAEAETLSPFDKDYKRPAETPLLPLSRLDRDTAPKDITEGVRRGVLEGLEGWTSPQGIAMLVSLGKLGRLRGVGQAFSAALGGGFDASMIGGMVEQVPEAKKLWDEGNQPEAARVAVQALITGALGVTGALHKGKVFKNATPMSGPDAFTVEQPQRAQQPPPAKPKEGPIVDVFTGDNQVARRPAEPIVDVGEPPAPRERTFEPEFEPVASEPADTWEQAIEKRPKAAADVTPPVTDVTPAVTSAPPEAPAGEQPEASGIPANAPMWKLPEGETALEPAAPAAEALAPEDQPERGPGWVGKMDVGEINVDAPRFQFKQDVGQHGVSDKLKDARKYNHETAGVIAVWDDPADGKTYVVNGHHRLDLAKRLGEPQVNVMKLSAADAGEARLKGAIINISEDQGTSIDAAKVFRDAGSPEAIAELERGGLQLKGKIASEGVALSKLANPIFADVVSGDLSPIRGAIIGGGIPNQADQTAFYKILDSLEKAGKRPTNEHVAEMIRMKDRAPVVADKGDDSAQISMWGDEDGAEVMRSLYPEKTEVSTYVRSQLGKEKRLFGLVGSQAAAVQLEKGGNVIKAEENKATAERAGQGLELYDRLSKSTGAIDGILDKAAKSLFDGENPNAVKERAYTAIRAEVQNEASRLAGVAPVVRGGVEGDGGQGARQAREGQHDQPADEVTDKQVATGKETPVVLQDFHAGRGGFAAPARMVVRSPREVTAEEIKEQFFPDFAPEDIQISKLRADDFMGAVQPGRQPFRIQFAKGGRHISAPDGIEERFGLKPGEQYHAPPASPLKAAQARNQANIEERKAKLTGAKPEITVHPDYVKQAAESRAARDEFHRTNEAAERTAELEAEIDKLQPLYDKAKGAERDRLAKQIDKLEIERLKLEDSKPLSARRVKPTKTGPHGRITTEFEGKPREGLAWVRAQKTGFAQGAIPHPAGNIGLTYGVEGDPAKGYSKGYGVSHIDAKHPGWLDTHLDDISKWPVVEEITNQDGKTVNARILADQKGNRVVVSRNWMGGDHPEWLLTGYDRPAPATRISVREAPEGAGPTPPATGRTSSVAPKATPEDDKPLAARRTKQEGPSLFDEPAAEAPKIEPAHATHKLSGAEQTSLVSAEAETASRKTAEKSAAELEGDRLTAQIKSGGAARPAKLKPAETRGLFEQDEPDQGGLFQKREVGKAGQPPATSTLDVGSVPGETSTSPGGSPNSNIAEKDKPLPQKRIAGPKVRAGTPLQQQLPEARIEHSTAGKERYPILLVNAQALNVIGGGGLTDHLGVTYTDRQGLQLIHRLDAHIRHARGLGLTEAVGQLETLQRALTQNRNRNHGRPLVIVQSGANVTAAETRGALHEELDHALQLVQTGGSTLDHLEEPGALFESPEGAIAAKALRETYDDSSDADLAMEVGVRLMRPGRFRELNLSDTQAIALAEHYVDLLETQHGERVGAIVERVYNAFGKTNQAALGARRGIRQAEPSGRTLQAKGKRGTARSDPEGSGDLLEGVGPLAQRKPAGASEEGPEFVARKTIAQAAVDYFKPVSTRIAQEGAAGKEIARKITRAHDVGEVQAGKRVVTLRDAGLHKLEKADRDNLLDALEGRGDPNTAAVHRAMEATRQVFGEIAADAIRARVEARVSMTLRPGDRIPQEVELSEDQHEQLANGHNVHITFRRPFRARKLYYPHVIPNSEALRSGQIRKDVLDNVVRQGDFPDRETAAAAVDDFRQFLDGGGRARKMEQYLIESGQARDAKEAELMMRQFRQNRVHREGTLEHSRTADIPFYDPDPGRVIPRVVVAQSIRMSEIRELGQANEQINELIREIEQSGGNADFVRRAIERALGVVNEPDTAAARISSGIRMLQGFKLGLAGIPNATQGALNSFLKSDLPSTIAGAGGLFSAAGRRFAMQSGASLEGVVNEMLRNVASEGRALGTYLKATGFTATEQANRVWAANAGAEYAKRMFNRLRLNPNDPRARQALAELGLKPDVLLKLGKLDGDAVLIAAKKFSDITQFRSGPLDLPDFASTPAGKVVFQFKSFVYGQTRLVYSETIAEAQAGRWGRGLRALLILATVFPITGEAVADLRSLITGRKRDATGLKRYLEDVAQAGALGVLYDLASSASYGKTAQFLLGPGLGSFADLADASARAAYTRRMQPLVKFLASQTTPTAVLYRWLLPDKPAGLSREMRNTLRLRRNGSI